MTELRSLLGSFLFSEDDVFKPIGVLSGGERNRYALARMLLASFELPSARRAHQPSRHARERCVCSRRWRSTTAPSCLFRTIGTSSISWPTRIFEIGGGRVEVFPGNYEDYVWRKQRAADGEDDPEAAGKSAPTLSDVPGYVSPQDEPRKRMNPIKQKQLQDRCQQLEGADRGTRGGNRRLRAATSVVRQRRRHAAPGRSACPASGRSCQTDERVGRAI